MSLLELIFSQKIIILTIGIAAFLLIAAVMLAIIPRLLKRRTEAKQRRVEQRAEQVRIDAVAAEEKAEAREAARASKTKKRRKGSQVAPSKSDAPVEPIIPVTAPKPVMSVVTPEKVQPPKDTPSGPPAGMQDILSSVFADDGAAERQVALLRGMGDVDISDLLTLSRQVIVQMQGGTTVTVVGSKELE